MSGNIVFEGWLTKSPPNKRLWKTKWRKRWFALRQSNELPGQYFLDYYADRKCRRLKGTINLDFCEQVDAGLHMERSGSVAADSKLRGSVFTLQTQSRVYHLEADSEDEMAKWVDAICRVCGLRPAQLSETPEPPVVIQTVNLSETNCHNEYFDSGGPYIPISECITGLKDEESRAFTFDPNNIVTSTRKPYTKITSITNEASQHVRGLSENESNAGEDVCRSLNANLSTMRERSMAKSFTKLKVDSQINSIAEDGPPVPPRPPKTLSVNLDTPNITHPAQTDVVIKKQPAPDRNKFQTLGLPRRFSHEPFYTYRPYSNSRTIQYEDDEDECHPSGAFESHVQYYNLLSLPPAVDRALKPRHSTRSMNNWRSHGKIEYENKTHTLQYLDLDLQISKKPKANAVPSISKSEHAVSTKRKILHGKSFSTVNADSAYKTVDFLKTEAFNITRQDAEASRNIQNIMIIQ